MKPNILVMLGQEECLLVALIIVTVEESPELNLQLVQNMEKRKYKWKSPRKKNRNL